MRLARALERHAEPVAVLSGHIGAVHGAVFSPKGRDVLTRRHDGTAAATAGWASSLVVTATRSVPLYNCSQPPPLTAAESLICAAHVGGTDDMPAIGALLRDPARTGYRPADGRSYSACQRHHVRPCWQANWQPAVSGPSQDFRALTAFHRPWRKNLDCYYRACCRGNERSLGSRVEQEKETSPRSSRCRSGRS